MNLNEQSRLAAAAILHITIRYMDRGHKYLSEESQDLLEKCFLEANGCDQLRYFHIQAARVAIKSGNVDTARMLLEKDAFKLLLADDPDNLQIALCIQDWDSFRSQDTIEMVKLVTQHGAQINGLDEKGNTPLYYACLLGWPSSFKFLIENGADFMTVHKFPVDERRAPKDEQLEYSFEQKTTEPVVDLMQIALRALDESNMVQNSIKESHKRWASIILFFTDAHFSSVIPVKILTELIENACCIGDIEAVIKLWHCHIASHARELASGQAAVCLVPGLMSATREGQVETVKLLLRFGVDPCSVCQNTRPPGRFGCGKNHNHAKTAISAVCEEDKKGKLQPKASSVLDACELLLLKGISKADQSRLMAQASLQGRIGMVQHLWEAGLRVGKVPITSSVIMLEFFHAHHTCFDWLTLQQYAIQVCNINALDWLTERAGARLHSAESLGGVIKSLTDRCTRFRDPASHHDFLPRASVDELQRAMLWYLSSDYAHRNHVTTEAHVQVNELLLRAAVECPSRLEMFLQEGVKSGCPAIRQACFSEFEKHRHSLKSGGGWFLLQVEIRVRALQLLLQCYNDTLARERRGDAVLEDSLWLMPDMMESDTDQQSTGDSKQRARVGSELGSNAAAKLVGSMSSGSSLSIDRTFCDETCSSTNAQWEGSCQNNNDSERDATHVEENNQRPAKQMKRDLSTTTIKSEEIAAQILNNGDGGSIKTNFIYETLGSVYATRLLVLEPSADPTASICCTLMNVHLAKIPRYEALSYVWGDDSPDAPIQVNGKILLIRKNLMVALTKIRSSKHPRVLWIDALCINQRDVEERNNQVRNMTTIYQSAERVLIWLGDSGDDSAAVFSGLRKFLRDGQSDTYRRPRTLFLRGATPGFDDETIEMFQRFCARPWFSRTWIIQEIALSKRAIVVCGNDREDWDLFCDVCPSPKFRTLQEIRDIPVADHPKNPFWSPTIEKILKHSISCGVTDLRDKAYALLGILNYPSIIVDYTQTVEEVYASFSQAVFEEERHIRLLHKFGIRRNIHSLPTWAVDLSVHHHTGVLPRRGPPGRTNEVPKGVARVVDGFRIQGFDMFIKGYEMDRIKEVGKPLGIRPETPYAAKRLAIRDTMRDWELCACRIDKPKFSAPVPAAFMTTLVAHDNTMNNH